jgi:hypothetical protein
MQTHRQQGYLTSLLLFFQNKESRLKYSMFELIVICIICGGMFTSSRNVSFAISHLNTTEDTKTVWQYFFLFGGVGLNLH